MKYTVFGAGSVGTVLAGAMAEAGLDVRIAGRGAVGRLHLEGDEETVDVTVPVVDDPEGIILLCVHEPDVVECCPKWPDRTVVTFQNGVTSEETAATWCNVIGGVWRMTCFLVEPGVADFTRRGRIVLGRYPEGRDEEVDAIAADLRRARFNVGVSPDIMGDKWLKLCLNVASTPNALVAADDHTRPEFGAVKAALLEEARDVLAAAGIEPRSGDGHDLPLAQEIEKHRTATRRLRPVYNQTWRMLSVGRRPPERYHDVILDVAAKANLEAPRSAAMLELLERAERPECYGVDEVFSAVCGT